MIPSEQHPSLERLRQYCEDSMPDFEAMALEDHFDGCSECMAAVRRMNALLYSGFSAQTHARAAQIEALRDDILANTLEAARETFREFAHTIEDWLAKPAALWGPEAVRHWGEEGLLPAHAGSQVPVFRIVLEEGESRAEIEIREEFQTLEVTVPRPIEALAVLFSAGATPLVRVARFQTATAVFEDIQEGHYFLAVSPPPAPEHS